MSEQPSQVYQYSVKLETDQKCVKPTVHVYHNDDTLARTRAIILLKRTIDELKSNGFTVAPLETK